MNPETAPGALTAPVGDIAATGLGGAHAPDMSILGLFMQADWVVKTVVILLLLASFWSWAIIIDKLRRLRRVQAQADQFEEAFWSGNSIDDLYDRINGRPDHPLALVFVAAMREWRRATDRLAVPGAVVAAGLQERIAKVMRVALNRELDGLERYLGFLATVGSTAPFVGLFGTVWGIMNSFSSIAVSKNTSLAVVAPGIAEALFATALGLVAAIPAVIAYNKLSSDVGRFQGRLEGFADEFSAILSRQIDERRS
ncbi:protein TolQ [Zavarzinia compransoris]|uniref:Tol-Pal system protein TolQ n=1 Tax=Zavarzinia compransoris TaxID=1264899 RepID=A0A317E2T3_9PROT|nr:protein TolQ [Zavarzinia compransoris]TDP44433.1 cell division and transport-associated protein TolQ [Zavarzinia compransoris]